MHEKPKAGAALILEIDLGALASNWRRVAELSAPAECSAVVKADAYGIGIEQAVRALSAAGCRTFFVAHPEEGQRAHAAAPEATIYVLDGYISEWAEAFRSSNLRPVLNTVRAAEAWAKEFSGKPSAIQVDTGMNRLGLSLADARALAGRADLLSAASPRLLISHLACSDEPANAMNRAQLARFNEARSAFPTLPCSLANSAGIHLGPEFCFDLVRPGIALYGAEFSPAQKPFAAVVTAKARVLQVRNAAAGETVGYGGEKRLQRDTQIAILAAGYADGYHRRSGSSDAHAGAFAFVRGRRAAILGRVSMDLFAIDVTDIPGVTEGDFVELFGPNMPIDEVARAAGTIGYEFLTQLSRRAERRYLGANPLPEGEGVAAGDG